MATMKLSGLVTPNPCNPAMEQRNWDGLRTALQKLDEILVINVDDVTNEITYDLHNITNITMEGDLNVGGDTTIEQNLNVTQDVTIGGDMEVTNVTVNENLTVDGTTTTTVLYATTVNSTNVNATYVTAYWVTTTGITSCYWYDCDGTELCPTECGGGGGSGGSGGTDSCCGVPTPPPGSLTVTISGAITGTGTLLPGGTAPADNCIDYIGDIAIDADNNCGGEFLQLVISLSCPRGGSSPNQLVVRAHGGGGGCQIAVESATDSGAVADPLDVSVDVLTEEMFTGGCPCGTGQTVTIHITE